jgi:20S proteasome subunit beta 1
VADIVTYYLSMFSVQHDSQPNVETASHLFSDMIYQNKDRLSAGIIVAGWDKYKGGTVYNVPLGGGVFQQPWAIGGKSASLLYRAPTFIHHS